MYGYPPITASFARLLEGPVDKQASCTWRFGQITSPCLFTYWIGRLIRLSAAAVPDAAGAQSSLPLYLRGRLPTRGSLLSLLRPATSHDNESISSVRIQKLPYLHLCKQQLLRDACLIMCQLHIHLGYDLKCVGACRLKSRAGCIRTVVKSLAGLLLLCFQRPVGRKYCSMSTEMLSKG